MTVGIGIPQERGRNVTGFLELSEADREAAVTILQRRLTDVDLRAVVKEVQGARRRQRHKSVEWLVAETEQSGSRLRSRLHHAELAEFLVDMAGTDLLGSQELRHRLARGASADELDRLHDHASDLRGRGGRDSQARAVARRNWHPGKAWATHFARTLGFPSVFAGITGTPREPDAIEVEPFRPLPDLEDFQVELKSAVLDVLVSPPGGNRGILTLPTGAGKTRTAIEALVEHRLSTDPRPGLLWIAQSDELCEQAVQAFREVWVDQGHRGDLREPVTIHRLWGQGRSVPAEPAVVVASIQKLHTIWRNGDRDAGRTDLEAMARQLGVVVVDEAHRMLAPSYGEVLVALGIDLSAKGASPLPLLGLTATPYRGLEEETRRLARNFHGRLLRPGSLQPDPVGELRRRRVLSWPDHRVIGYGGRAFSIDADPKYREWYRLFNDFHPDLLRELGEERARNRLLLDILCDLPVDWPVLFFGCSVEHATAMSVLLRRRGRAAATVTASTRAATRRALIEQFRAGELAVLSNYGVLTTGFDAPRVAALVIARPTASPVLYEQMIGRGMRGPQFGGTETCLVIDVEDNIRFGGQLAFTRYDGYWSSRPGEPTRRWG